MKYRFEKLVFLSFQAKKVKFTILQKVIEIIFFFTFNHSNTLKENELHNINHYKYIDRAKATQSKLNFFRNKIPYYFNLEHTKIVCNFTTRIN